LNGLSGGHVVYGGVYDGSIARTADGSGSVKLPGGSGAWLYSDAIPVTPGKTYTLAAYMNSKGWPPGSVYQLFRVSDAGGGYIRYGGPSVAADSRPDKWEEIAMVITPDANTHYIVLQFARMKDTAGVIAPFPSPMPPVAHVERHPDRPVHSAERLGIQPAGDACQRDQRKRSQGVKFTSH
jgi:hypothetical protein